MTHETVKYLLVALYNFEKFTDNFYAFKNYSAQETKWTSGFQFCQSGVWKLPLHFNKK